MVEVEAVVNPTEEFEKVKRALKNIFPEIPLESIPIENERILLKGKDVGIQSLSNLRDMLKREHIRSTARSIMLSSVINNCIVFSLNKQAAYAKRVSFSDPEIESPLGSIEVKIIAEDLVHLLDWLTPSGISEIKASSHSSS
ncbi:MAG: RNA-binding domain-containing protein [Candidatus Bathyarchaeia archaeon]